jgi:hypothetical protein
MNKTLRTVLIVSYHVFCIVIFLKGISLIAMPDYACNSVDFPIGPIGAPAGCPLLFSAIQGGQSAGYIAITASFVLELLYWFIFRPWLVMKTHVSVLQKVIGKIAITILGLLLILALISLIASWAYYGGI